MRNLSLFNWERRQGRVYEQKPAKKQESLTPQAADPIHFQSKILFWREILLWNFAPTFEYGFYEIFIFEQEIAFLSFLFSFWASFFLHQIQSLHR